MKVVEIKNRCIGAGIPKVCVPIVAKDEQSVKEQLEQILEKNSAGAGIDIVEFRGDFFEGVADMERLTSVLNDMKEAFRDIILLFTIRSEQEGGEKVDWKSQKINDINRYVVENELADMVDLELESDEQAVKSICEVAKQHKVKIIMSNHDFGKTPDNDVITGRLKRMREFGADIAKIAVMPQNTSDVIRLLEATRTMRDEEFDIPVVTMSMGKIGAISRIAGEVFGSAVTFASLNNASAPGQIPLGDMRKALQIIDEYCCE